MLKTSDRELNINMINMLKAPVNMVNSIHKQTAFINRWVIFEDIKKL